MSIYYYRLKNWIKENENMIVLAAGLLLVAVISFGTGSLWRENQYDDKASIVIKKQVQDPIVNNQGTQDQNAELKSKNNDNVATIFYIASKNGKSYHLPSCPGAKQIKPENKIEFQSKEEAESRGYKPAANCLGLQ